MDIPHARELPSSAGPDNAAIALAQWLKDKGPIVAQTLLNRKAGETPWYFPCPHAPYRAGQAKIASYMHERGYIIQWLSSREAYREPQRDGLLTVEARKEGFQVRIANI